MTDERDTRTLLRRLCGELTPDEERRLDERLAADAELRAAAERLERDWRRLEAPGDAAPAGFADEVMARLARAEAEPEAPAWARLAAAAALVAGIAVGMGIAPAPPPDGLPGEFAGPPLETLADSYLAALEELEREVGR